MIVIVMADVIQGKRGKDQQYHVSNGLENQQQQQQQQKQQQQQQQNNNTPISHVIQGKRKT